MSKKGFTLIEVLFGLILLAVGLIMIAGIFDADLNCPAFTQKY